LPPDVASHYEAGGEGGNVVHDADVLEGDVGETGVVRMGDGEDRVGKSFHADVETDLLLAMTKMPKTEVPTDNGLPPSVLSGRLNCSGWGYRRIR
jgi:hypothetical protein